MQDSQLNVNITTAPPRTGVPRRNYCGIKSLIVLCKMAERLVKHWIRWTAKYFVWFVQIPICVFTVQIPIWQISNRLRSSSHCRGARLHVWHWSSMSPSAPLRCFYLSHSLHFPPFSHCFKPCIFPSPNQQDTGSIAPRRRYVQRISIQQRISTHCHRK